jgi:type II secretion system protein H
VTRRRRQFTLLELMLVLAVVATLGVMVAPRMSASLGLSRLRNQAREAVAMARLARSRAATEGRVYLLSFDAESRSLRLLRRRDPLAAPSDAESPERELPADDQSWSRAAVFQDGVVWALGDPLEIAFRPAGEADPARLVLGAGEDRLQVVIDGPLALARIEGAE